MSDDKIICPICGSTNVHKWNESIGRYMCKTHRGTFTVGNGMSRTYVDGATLLQALEHPLKGPKLHMGEITTSPVDGLTAVLPDAHLDLEEGYHPAYSVAKAMTFDLQPNRVIFLGDWIELASFNAWNSNKRKLMEGVRYKQEINFALRELEDFRSKLPNTEFIFFEGNHEYRLPRYIEQHPELEGIIDVRKDLHIDDFGMEWVDFNSIRKIGKLNYLHGIFYNLYFARSTLNAIGESCLFGHSHKSQTWVQRLHRDKRPSIGKGIGCLCSVDPAWKRGNPTNFVNSFALVEYREGGLFTAHEIFIVDGGASWGGRVWQV